MGCVTPVGARENSLLSENTLINTLLKWGVNEQWATLKQL